MIAFNIGLIHCTIGQNDSVRLSFEGFKTVLVQRNSLLGCEEIMLLKDRKVSLLELQVGIKESQIKNFDKISNDKDVQIKKLKRLVWNRNLRLWVMSGLSVILTYKLIW